MTPAAAKSNKRTKQKGHFRIFKYGQKAAGASSYAIGRSRSAQMDWGTLYGRRALVPPPDGLSKQGLADLLTESTDLSACCFQIARDVCSGGWHLVETPEAKVVDEGTLRLQKEKLEKFFEDAPGGPKSDITLTALLECVIVDRESTGEGYLEIARDPETGEPTAIFHLRSVPMLIRKDEEGFAEVKDGGRKLTWFRAFASDPRTGMGGEDGEGDVWAGLDSTEGAMPGVDDAGVPVALNEAMRFPHYHPASDFYGVPPSVPAVRAIQGNTHAADRNIKFFYNKALPEIALIISGNTENVDDEEMQSWMDGISDHFMTELQSEHFKPLMMTLPPGITLEVVKMSPETRDGDHSDYQVWNRNEILRAYSMMPNRVGIIESGNIGGGTGESQIEIYKVSVVEPRQEMFERAINRIIREGFGINTWAFQFNELDATDELATAQMLAILGALAWLTVNEGRKAAAPLLKSLGVELEDIDEDWADRPFPITSMQLGLGNMLDDIVVPVDPSEESPHANGNAKRSRLAALAKFLAGNSNKAAIERHIDEVYRNGSRDSDGEGGPAA